MTEEVVYGIKGGRKEDPKYWITQWRRCTRTAPKWRKPPATHSEHEEVEENEDLKEENEALKEELAEEEGRDQRTARGTKASDDDLDNEYADWNDV